MQAPASKGSTAEFTSSLPSYISHLSFCGDWHRPYFVMVIWVFCFLVGFLLQDHIRSEQNPEKSKPSKRKKNPRKACLHDFPLTLAASKLSPAQAAQQAGTKRFCKCTVVSFPFQSTSELQWNHAGLTSDHIFFGRFSHAAGVQVTGVTCRGQGWDKLWSESCVYKNISEEHGVIALWKSIAMLPSWARF